MPKQRDTAHGPKPEGIQLRASDIRNGQLIRYVGGDNEAKHGDWQVMASAPEPSTFWLQRYVDGRYETLSAHIYDLRSKSVLR